MDLPDGLRDLLERNSLCYLTTLMPDGSPQITQTWADTDGKHVLINTVRGHQKVRNIERDGRVAVAIGDPDESRRYFQVRGRVIAVTEEGAAEHIEVLSHRYLGAPYPWFGGRDQVRLLVTIEPEHITGQ
ncbi:PPOX class F420-dependent oxidoreductase [Dactylosporangium sp. CA-052675]|uniref:PPOX class F420-dependent oxidoreductase n=1 Tax=Dactylosporangium sp. CA-052675 TaxID=3239927 RepID=UPI003D8DBB8C